MIRWATPEDAPDLAEVHVTTWQKAYEGILPASFLEGLDRDGRSRWWRRFIEEGTRVHVAEADRIVGFCHPGASSDERWGEIFAIYVHPDYWGSGYGYELLTAGEKTLVDQGHDRALLWVLEENSRGRQFYERQGWTPGKPFRVEEIGGMQVTELRYEKNLRGCP